MRNVRQASDNVSTLILIFTHFAFFSIHFTFYFHYNCYASILRAARPLREKKLREYWKRQDLAEGRNFCVYEWEENKEFSVK